MCTVQAEFDTIIYFAELKSNSMFTKRNMRGVRRNNDKARIGDGNYLEDSDKRRRRK